MSKKASAATTGETIDTENKMEKVKTLVKEKGPTFGKYLLGGIALVAGAYFAGRRVGSGQCPLAATPAQPA